MFSYYDLFIEIMVEDHGTGIEGIEVLEKLLLSFSAIVL